MPSHEVVGGGSSAGNKRPFREFTSRTGWLAWGAILTLVLTGLGAGLLALVTDKPPSLADQLESIRTEVAQTEQFPAVLRRVDFHGTGVESLFLVLRDNQVAAQAFPLRSPRGDEIRIYDPVDGTYQLSFSFEPEREIDEGFDAPPDASGLHLFTISDAVDVNGDGATEVVGSFSKVYMGPEFAAPVVIAWNFGMEQYAIEPLLRNRAHLRPIRPKGGYARSALSNYRQPLLLNNVALGPSIAAYQTEDFALIEQGTRLLVIAAFVTRAEAHADEPAFRLIPFGFSVGGSSTALRECPRPQDSRIVVQTAPGDFLPGIRFDNLLIETWHENEYPCFEF